MHELSVMSQVVEALLKELDERFGPGGPGSEEREGAGGRRGMGGGGAQLVRVESVVLEVGELTMLAEEPLRFAWSALTGRGPLKGARLEITSRPAILECPGCGYRGRGRSPDASADHLALPALFCPCCGGEVRVVGGRECVVREMRAVVDDGGAGGGRTRSPRMGLRGRARGAAGARAPGRGRAGARARGRGSGRSGARNEGGGRGSV